MDQLIVEDPTRIGPYRLIARLGAGGMGLVYLGRSEGGRTVAVKVVQAEYAGNPEFRRRFAREVAAARRVGGSWTAAVLDADPEAAVPWVATQYIPGPDLHAVVAKDFGPLPEHSVRTLANRLALALQAVHEAGLIHRDLKPSNVLVTVDGPRVIDFGIARAMDSLAGDSLLTHTGMLIGSAGFMSPEQVRGLELTPASDVFCLGAVLVYAATGRLLFGAADTGLNAHLFRVAEEEADLTGVPEELIELVRACLHKDPARRPTPRQVVERTSPDRAGEWLPGTVLAQLGRHAAELLDFAPAMPAEPPAAQADPRVPSARPEPWLPVPPPPEYAPTAPADFGPAQGFGPPPVPTGGGWTATPSTASGESASPHSKRWRGLAVAALAQLMVVFQATLFSAALPGLHRDLRIDGPGPFFTAYVVAFGAVLLFGGHLVDLLGRRRTMLIGLVGFAAACALGAAGGSGGVLVAARVLQGVFGALVTPAGLALVAAGFTDPKERGKAFGIYATLVGGGSALVLFASGWLVEGLAWEVALYAAVPIAVIALICALALPHDRPAPGGARLDVPGVLLGSSAVAALVYGLGASESHGWGAPLALLPVAVGAVLLAVFLQRQTRSAHPLLPPYVLGDRNRAGSLLALLLAGAGLLILFLSVSFHLQYVLGYAPSVIGLLLLPMFAAVVIGSTQISGRLLHRAAPNVLIAAGLVLTAAGLLLLTGLEVNGVYEARVLPGTILAGLGTGLAFAPILATATNGVAPRHVGAASAAVMTALHLGEAISGAVLAAVFAGRSRAGSYDEVDEYLVSGYTATLWWAFGGVLLAALLAGLMVNARPSRSDAPQAAGPSR
ncbi:MDR family MFS transporter [Streptomyces sp. NBC_01244]|uniref:MDR family MFS transporter n=1 Tax=Streptomyces sp. NBC_01244 TaxID=2903797 RepID=UPI002E100296|nr:MDR family MFS transporter [Streptomyces sp. NBC_01244]